MKPTLIIGNATIYHGNNLEVLPTLEDNSVDSIVCDPPYELGFMGKSWDSSGIAYSVELWQECLRVLKPGGHLLAFGGTRTWHRLAVAIEDAGFEIRDNIAWLYGSGFPKSHNISKAIDKAAGAEREVVGQSRAGSKERKGFQGDMAIMPFASETIDLDITASATDEAKAWDGWGTALKPAHEPIVVARKPVEGTIAANVLKHGVGGLNIDATRIGAETRFNSFAGNKNTGFTANDDRTDAGKGLYSGNNEGGTEVSGRWPANIILDEYTAKLLDEQSDASRFFYVAKANKRDRNEGLDELPEVRHADRNATDGVGGDNPRNRTNQAKQNFHPTVKPTALMQYLIRLVTPSNGVVLDPFTGSGSTGKAALLEGKKFLGIELTEEYLPIIAGRLEHAANTMEEDEGDLFASL